MIKILLSIIMLSFFLSVQKAEAKSTEKEEPYDILSLFQSESKRFNVPVLVLLAIAKTESNFNPWALNIAGKSYKPRTKEEALAILEKNRKKSYDVGIMQINSWWLRKYNIPIEKAFEPQINILVGAYILSHEMKKHRGLNWKSIGAYHSPTEYRQKRYYNKVRKHILYLEKILLSEK